MGNTSAKDTIDSVSARASLGSSLGKSSPTITDDITGSPSSSSSIYVAESGKSGWSIYTWIAIFVFLAMLGLNVFGIMASIIDFLANIFGEPVKDFAKTIGFYTGETIKQTVELSAEGTKFGADVAKDVVVNTVDTVAAQTEVLNDAIDSTDALNVNNDDETYESNISNTRNEGGKTIPYVDRDELTNSFNDALNNRNNSRESSGSYIEDDAASSIQNGGITGKQGWCYVGEDRGFRSCVEVGTSHECMSGNLFPSKDVCVNPNLRH
jgi:hypothetical protein